MTGISMEQLKENKELQEKLWGEAQEAFKVPSSWFKTSDGKVQGGPWIMGNEVTMSDTASGIAFAVILAGEDSEEWKKIDGWSEGLWSALWERTRPYFKVY